VRGPAVLRSLWALPVRAVLVLVWGRAVLG